MVLDALRRYYGPADTDMPKVTIAAVHLPALLQIHDLKAQKNALEAQARKLDEQIKKAYLPFVEQLGNACSAVCENQGQRVTFTYNPQYRTKAQYPDVYDDFVETTESRVFKITKTAV